MRSFPNFRFLSVLNISVLVAGVVDGVSAASSTAIYCGKSTGAIVARRNVSMATSKGWDDPSVVPGMGTYDNWSDCPGLDLVCSKSFFPQMINDWSDTVNERMRMMTTATAEEAIAKKELLMQAKKLRINEEDAKSAGMTNVVPGSHKSGVKHVHLVQRHRGIPVVNGVANVAIKGGKAISLHSSFKKDVASKVDALKPKLSAEDAIFYAASSLGLDVNIGSLVRTHYEDKNINFQAVPGLSQDAIPVKLVYWILEEEDVVKLSWQLVLRLYDNENWLNLWVGTETGTVLARNNWICGLSSSYSVYERPYEAPTDVYAVPLNVYNVSAMTIVEVQDNLHWHNDGNITYNTTRGNNVIAGDDRDNNNQTKPVIATSTKPLTFNYSDQNITDYNPVNYLQAAVTNVFYWNNKMHDILYEYGFDESSGNFQQNNFNKGGEGNDPVYADAQDGGGQSNSYFSTPPDGTSPRMQLYLFWGVREPPNLTVDGTSYVATVALFGPNTTNLVGKEVVSVGIYCNATTDDNLTDKIALIDRGSCLFVTKVLNAQSKGAVGVIVANNVNGTITMALPVPFNFSTPTIPSVSISLADGNDIKNNLTSNATLSYNAPGPALDSSFDIGVIAHEYCHGLSTRLTGGPSNSNCLSNIEQAGEGWSDLCALFVTQPDEKERDRAFGAYVYGRSAGIRPYLYSRNMTVNPMTYSWISGKGLSIPGDTGSIWATALYDLYWDFIDEEGYDSDLYRGKGGNNMWFQILVDGMKFQPCNPNFIQSRDAYLKASHALYKNKYNRLIWAAFARRGMGSCAQSTSNNTVLRAPIESFELPCGSLREKTPFYRIDNGVCHQICARPNDKKLPGFVCGVCKDCEEKGACRGMQSLFD